MDWLTNWDDVIHGTAVFSAAVPFCVAFALAWRLPTRFWWVAAVAALVGPFFWLFGVPNIPPRSSEDVMLCGLALCLVGLLLGPRLTVLGRFVVWMLLFAGLAWSVYPAWLAEEGGISRKILVCGGVTASIAVLATITESLGRDGQRLGVSVAAFIPPAIALALLLQFGGSARFGQAAGALAASAGALCVLLIARKQLGTPAGVAALWGALFALLGWSGWLFAEIRYGLVCLLLLAPAASLLVSAIPLPRGNAFLAQLWDGLASAAVATIPAWIAIADYMAEADEFEGY